MYVLIYSLTDFRGSNWYASTRKQHFERFIDNSNASEYSELVLNLRIYSVETLQFPLGSDPSN